MVRLWRHSKSLRSSKPRNRFLYLWGNVGVSEPPLSFHWTGRESFKGLLHVSRDRHTSRATGTRLKDRHTSLGTTTRLKDRHTSRPTGTRLEGPAHVSRDRYTSRVTTPFSPLSWVSVFLSLRVSRDSKEEPATDDRGPRALAPSVVLVQVEHGWTRRDLVQRVPDPPDSLDHLL